MATYKTPGVYVEEIALLPRVINGEPTSVAGFIGTTQHIQRGDFDNDTLINSPTRITSLAHFTETFGTYDKVNSPYLAISVKAFFEK